MQVEDERSPFASVDGRQAPARKPIWEQSEVSTSCHGQPASENLGGRQWPFHDGLSTRCGHAVRNPLGARDAVAVMAHRKDARVVSESEFNQNIEGPERSAHDGVTRRAISEYRSPGSVFEEDLRTPRFLEELLSRLLVDQTMRKAVAGDLVAARGNLSDQLRISLGYPSRHEESRSDVELLEDREQSCVFATTRSRSDVPTITMYAWRQCRNVKVVLDVNGKRVLHVLGGVAAEMISCDGTLPGAVSRGVQDCNCVLWCNDATRGGQWQVERLTERQTWCGRRGRP